MAAKRTAKAMTKSRLIRALNRARKLLAGNGCAPCGEPLAGRRDKMRTKTRPRSNAQKLPLMKRYELNKAKQLRRIAELEDEMDKALDRGEVSKLPSQDPKYLALRHEYEALDREFDQRNLKRLTAQSVAIYGGEGGKTVTSVSALSRARPSKKKPKRKPRFRL